MKTRMHKWNKLSNNELSILIDEEIDELWLNEWKYE